MRSRRHPSPAARGGGLLLLCALGLLGVLPPARATADAPAPPSREQIDKAIAGGVAWILEEQKPSGVWGSGKHALGKTALAVHALQHAGLAEDQGTKASRRLARAFKLLDKSGAGRSKRRETDTRTYEASLLLMLLRARGRAADRERMQRLATLLCSTQLGNGQWWYDGKGGRYRTGGDNSNTQFALLALGLAHGEGLKVHRHVLDRTRTWWTKANAGDGDGGFGYASGGSARSASTGSMTAAGIACLAIVDSIVREDWWSVVEDPNYPSLRSRKKATAFLARVFSVTKNHGPSIDRKPQRQRKSGRGWLHYFLWTVERAMVLSGEEKLGRHDWYAEGARHLLATQRDDGSWRGEHPLYATCFALLFLTRAADRPRAFTPRAEPPEPGVPRGPTVTPSAPEQPAAEGEPEQRPDAPQPAAPLPPGTVLDWLQEDLPVGELPRRCRLAGAGSLPPLVRALQHPKDTVRQRAFEALRALLPDERTWRVDRHPLPRGRLALWLRLNARHLVLKGERFRLP